MNTVPDADVAITEDLVRGLLAAQHPDLAPLPLRPSANGWDNVVYRLGDDRAVRLPRRAVGDRLLLNEVRWLPFLAPRLPLPVPAALRRGRPTDDYPYHWAVVPWFHGHSAATVAPGIRDGYAVELARFLKALHVPAPADAPRNPVRGVPLAEWEEAFRRRLAGWEEFRGTVLPDGSATALPAAADLARIWEQALDAPTFSGPRLWLHGDPHPHNTILDDAGNLAAMADFGDLCQGDPASDIAVAWLHFGREAHAAFRDVLRYDAGTWLRARGWAVSLGLIMAMHATTEPLHEVGLHALRRIASEPADGLD